MMRTSKLRKSRSCGVTLLELLVVLGVIGVLVALLIPAVQMARETARQAQCKNHLKQLAIGALIHEEALEHFPTGGWGNRWTGDPDRGFGLEQPGGWIYNILPFIEEKQLRDIGKGTTGIEKRLALRQLFAHPMPQFYCPTRRTAELYPYNTQMSLRNALTPYLASKADYAICGGDVVLSGGSGPASTSPRILRDYDWPQHKQFNGISFVASEIRATQVTDGTSSTYLLGEKLYKGPWVGDDQSGLVGDDADIRRWTAQPPKRDEEESENAFDWFGSPHPSGCHFAMCDGSVQFIAYRIDAEIHRRRGNRRDSALSL